MKDNTQPTNVLEENSNEVTEQIEESQDLVVLTNSVSSNFLDVDDLDPITQAIRQEILQKQRDILREYIAQNHDLTVTNYDDQEFAEYLKNVNNRPIIDQAFANTTVKTELENTEIVGYRKVHYNFADQFHTMNWQDGDRQGNVRSQIVRNDSGDELATIKETTHKINALVSLSDGTLKQINNYRTIDFPTELPSKTGSMHLSLAVKDENGRNIALDRAVYFTAHYDSQGKLSEISSPKPVRFNGEGDEAIGYIEHLGQVYSLPVTQGKYREMMLALEKNKGQEIALSQNITTAQDMMITANVVHSDLPIQQEKKEYHHDRQELAEETLEKTAEQTVSNQKLSEDRKSLQQLAEQDPTLARKLVAEHYATHAVAYHHEKTADTSSTALEELENTVKICGGHKKLGLASVRKQLSELDKTRKESSQEAKELDKLMVQLEESDELRKKAQLVADILPKSSPYKEKLAAFLKLKPEEKEPIITATPLAKSEEIDDSLKTDPVKKAGRMIERFMSKDSPSNTPPPLNRSKLQLKNTQINGR
ncbi:Sca4 family protein [Candidatus Tisiphia endosymbiont of Ceraclea dissimilis]|uniref:Sca4 family protein n=1 Tax=Candidatus Tisiphia endosymbiont of Ceraclea dissimilis TaxID=3077928 RepID=UPI003CCAD4D4